PVSACDAIPSLARRQATGRLPLRPAGGHTALRAREGFRRDGALASPASVAAPAPARRDGWTRGGSPGTFAYCGGHGASPSPCRSSFHHFVVASAGTRRSTSRASASAARRTSLYVHCRSMRTSTCSPRLPEVLGQPERR